MLHLGAIWAPFGLLGEPLGSIWALLGGIWGPLGLRGVIFRRPESKKGAQKGLSWDFHAIFKDFIVFLEWFSQLFLHFLILFIIQGVGSFLNVQRATRVHKRISHVIFMLYFRILYILLQWFPQLGTWSRLRRRRRRRPLDMQCSVSKNMDVSWKLFTKLSSFS